MIPNIGIALVTVIGMIEDRKFIFNKNGDYICKKVVKKLEF